MGGGVDGGCAGFVIVLPLPAYKNWLKLSSFFFWGGLFIEIANPSPGDVCFCMLVCWSLLTPNIAIILCLGC
jgi:hypothetical protein